MSLLDSILSFVFPSVCVACGAACDTTLICKICYSAIPRNTSLFCGSCRRPFASSKPKCHRHSYVLGVAASYKHRTVRTLVHTLKFNGARDVAFPLARLLSDYFTSLHIQLRNPIVIPIPLHPHRERARGFNQSALIAEFFASDFSFQFAPLLLNRVRYTEPQSEIYSQSMRKQNLRSCFTLASGDALNGKTVILVDDVTTSGATFDEAANCILSGLPDDILALAIAKA